MLKTLLHSVSILLLLPFAPPRLLSQTPDDRFKADILVVLAHPDDEGMVIAYLAKAALDQHKRIAILYGTRGNGGGNAIGLEQAAALGEEREIEARQAVATLGITNVWFIGAPDTPGQDVLRSLETWNHGAALWQVVRIVRLTRPQVIMTWLPAYSSGENHGDHQAAGVLASEAFDLAADPTIFSEQVTPPRDATVSGNLTEGLQTWQPQKLYLFSDTDNPTALDGKGPQYPWSEVSPSRQITYGRLALESIANHKTQDYPGQMAAAALEQPDLGPLKNMSTHLVLGKSLVPSSVTGDVFEGTVSTSLPFKRVTGYQPETHTGLSAELGGPWAFYRQFWRAHDLPTAQVFPPQVRVPASSQVSIPVLLHNNTSEEATFELSAIAWTSPKGIGRYKLKAFETRSIVISLWAPPKDSPPQKLQMMINGTKGQIAALSVDVNVSNGGLPQ